MRDRCGYKTDHYERHPTCIVESEDSLMLGIDNLENILVGTLNPKTVMDRDGSWSIDNFPLKISTFVGNPMKIVMDRDGLRFREFNGFSLPVMLDTSTFTIYVEDFWSEAVFLWCPALFGARIVPMASGADLMKALIASKNIPTSELVMEPLGKDCCGPHVRQLWLNLYSVHAMFEILKCICRLN